MRSGKVKKQFGSQNDTWLNADPFSMSLGVAKSGEGLELSRKLDQLPD